MKSHYKKCSKYYVYFVNKVSWILFKHVSPLCVKRGDLFYFFNFFIFNSANAFTKQIVFLRKFSCEINFSGKTKFYVHSFLTDSLCFETLLLLLLFMCLFNFIISFQLLRMGWIYTTIFLCFCWEYGLSFFWLIYTLMFIIYISSNSTCSFPDFSERSVNTTCTQTLNTLSLWTTVSWDPTKSSFTALTRGVVHFLEMVRLRILLSILMLGILEIRPNDMRRRFLAASRNFSAFI